MCYSVVLLLLYSSEPALSVCVKWTFQVVLLVRNPPASTGDIVAVGCDLKVRKISWRRAWQPTQHPCPQNPMDRGAWWATVHGVTKSWITEST